MDSNLPRRKPLRLPDFDYSLPGHYFVTVCVRHRDRILGTIDRETVNCNAYGAIVSACWRELPEHYPHLMLDEFIVMPDHVHGLVFLTDALLDPWAGRAALRPAPTQRPVKRPTLPEIVRAFKSFSARGINTSRGTPRTAFWQRGYFERVVRNPVELQAIRRYIRENPSHWMAGRFHQADDEFLGRLVGAGRSGSAGGS